MHLGYSTMNNLQYCRPDTLGRLLEERGFESLWIGEHSHIPVARTTPYPAGGEMPEPYKHMADPLVSLAMAAAVTTRLRLGTGVLLPLERELFSTAKALATLDQLSGGRLLLGIGVGWNEEEFDNVAKMSWAKRYAGLKECVAALRALWTQDEAEFHGEYYDFEKVWCYPKPHQQPCPLVHLGVAGKIGTAHAAEWADVWFPIDVGTKDFGPRLERFRAAVKEAGRDPAQVGVSVVTFGKPGADTLRRYRDLGVNRVVVGGAREDEDSMSATQAYLDYYAALIPELS
jgi:probable F420-dependent oxidoreductase